VGQGDTRKGCGRMNMMQILVLIFENGKMWPVETIPGMGKGV
jgi:hypothetical protein